MKKLSLEDINAELVNLILFFIGLLLTLFGVLWIDEHQTFGTIMISVGSSIISSTIIVYVTSKYLIRKNQISEIIERWGLIGIYKTRAEMNQSADIAFDKLKKELDMISFGLKSFRSVKGTEIEAKVRAGLRMRILTMNPDSPMVAMREKAENEVPGQIKKTIIDLQSWIDKLKSVSPKQENVQLKFYNNLPLESYYRQDDCIYTGPYLYGKPSQQTISFEYKKNSLGYDYWDSYFNSIWNDSECTKE
jgi:hypothetical protein